MKINIPDSAYITKTIWKDSTIISTSSASIVVNETEPTVYNIQITVEVPSVADKNTIQASYRITPDKGIACSRVEFYPLYKLPTVFEDVKSAVENALDFLSSKGDLETKQNNSSSLYTFTDLIDYLSNFTLDWAKCQFSVDGFGNAVLTISDNDTDVSTLNISFNGTILDVQTKKISATFQFVLSEADYVSVCIKLDSLPLVGFKDYISCKVDLTYLRLELLEAKRVFLEISRLSNIEQILDYITDISLTQTSEDYRD